MNAADVVSFLGKDVVSVSGQCDKDINSVVSFQSALLEDNQCSLTWVNDKLAVEYSGRNLNVGILIISPESASLIVNVGGITIVSEKPRFAFKQILTKWFGSRNMPFISPTAVIYENVKLGVDCFIGHHVVVEENCVIGDNCEILHNTVLLKNTIVGNNVRIGANCTIGNYGFGYEADQNGDYSLIEHLGNVIIEDDVEIHNNSCVDRAVLGSTLIQRNVKIDNLVHIAHGAVLEENCLVIAHAMIAGSVRVGKNSWVSPGALIKNKVTIGADALVGLGAVVLKDVNNNETVIGNPAENIFDYKSWSVVRKQLLQKKGKD